MLNLTSIIKRYPIVSFFVLAFSFSWILFLVYMIIPNEISLILVIVAIYAPAYSALIISKITGTKDVKNNALVKWIVFLIVWLIASITFVINYLVKVSSFSLIIMIGGIVVGLLPSIVISSGFSQNLDIKKVFQSYLKPSGHLGYYLFAILYLPLVLLLGISINLLIGQSVIWIALPSGFELFGYIIITILYTFFFGGGTNEEPGWRGFALPKLQAKFSPLIASLILGIIWGLWHAPIYLPQYGSIFQFTIFLLNTLKITIMLTWLYNRTEGSVLATALLHSIGNLSFEFIPTTIVAEIIQIIVPIVLIIFDRMWKK